MSGHILIAELRDDRGEEDAGPYRMRYEIECPNAPEQRRARCGCLEHCGCDPRDSLTDDEADDYDPYEWIERDENVSCPKNGEDHHVWDGDLMTAGTTCWPRMMLQEDYEPAYLLNLSEPGQYPVEFEAEDGEYLVLNLAAS